MNYLSKHVYMYPTFKHTLYSSMYISLVPRRRENSLHTLYVHANIHGDITEYVRILTRRVVQYERSGMG